MHTAVRIFTLTQHTDTTEQTATEAHVWSNMMWMSGHTARVEAGV